jgi:hypothetical protein
MTSILIIKAALIWLGIACLAVGNGLVRENIIAPKLGASVALPLSGLMLSITVFAVTYFSFGFIGIRKPSTYFLIGAQWVLMTLAFELLFGHFVSGKSWSALFQTFNVAKGDLFTLVLVVSFLSPYAVAKIKGVI